jgi:glutamyl/glutaminyl-tRNA synthetase
MVYLTKYFASIVDDHLMQTTHVIRGGEWLSSLPKHVQLYEAFGWEAPIWVHPSLILDENRKKLSQRSEAQTRFTSYIEEGYLPEAMLNFLATMGWSAGEDRKLYSREELIEKFSLEGIVNHPAIFDLHKLNDLQGEYVRMKSVEDLARLILPWLQKAGYVSDEPSEDEWKYLLEVTALIQDRLILLKDAPDLVSYFYTDDFDYEKKGAKKHLAKDSTPALLKSVIEELEKVNDWTVENIDPAVRAAGAAQEMEGGKVIHPVRMSITGRTWGPGLFELMHVIGKNHCVARLQKAAERDWSEV